VALRIYSLLLWLLTPAYLLRLWWRGRAEPQYRFALARRLGFYSEPQSVSGAVWVHAVSLGETLAAAALISALRAERPGMRLLLTHSTATGFAAGSKLLKEGDAQTWLPFDTPQAVRRFLDHNQPAIGVLMETEIWPNLMQAAAAKKLPMVLANARLSERSLRKAQRLSSLMRPAAAHLNLVLAQTKADAARLREAGAVKVQVSGNLKFDVTPNAAQGVAWRAALNRPVLLAAVTREGEEAQLLAAWTKQPVQQAERPLLLIVPRHPQRFDEVAALAAASGLSLARRSAWQATPGTDALNADVWLGDSMGEMPLYYALAQVALLGGSFAPLGGQNLIEAAACGCPVVMGPHTFNFAQAAELAQAAEAAVRVADMNEGVHAALALMQSPRRGDVVQNALAFAAQHRGAAARMAHEIAKLLSAPTSPTGQRKSPI
jgi:3-deoxy-D-manno-octulosonic-acid transferase